MENFLKVLNVPYDDLFSCPLCGDCPCTIIADCKEMGIRREQAVPYSRPVFEGLEAREAL